MADTFDTVKDRLLELLKAPNIAEAAGIDENKWASYHVFWGGDNYPVLGMNRGRLPFLEVNKDDMGFRQNNAIGGLVTTNLKINVHLGSRFGVRSEADLESLGNSIALAIIVAMRNDPYFRKNGEGANDRIPAMEGGPYGYQIAINIPVEHSYSKVKYS